MQNVTDIAGLILAAGESKRMGEHKALKKNADGMTFLARQAYLLHDAGCERITAVVGADADRIMAAHRNIPITWIINERWERGQFSSIQTGLTGLLEITTTGVILQPVDVVGVRLKTVSALLQTALANPHLAAVVPEYEDRGGHPIYLARSIFEDLINLNPTDPNSRLDVQLANLSDVMRLPVSDPAIRSNVNRPDDWD